MILTLWIDVVSFGKLSDNSVSFLSYFFLGSYLDPHPFGHSSEYFILTYLPAY